MPGRFQYNMLKNNYRSTFLGFRCQTRDDNSMCPSFHVSLVCISDIISVIIGGSHSLSRSLTHMLVHSSIRHLSCVLDTSLMHLQQNRIFIPMQKLHLNKINIYLTFIHLYYQSGFVNSQTVTNTQNSRDSPYV